jgi:hypothetical protein
MGHHIRDAINRLNNAILSPSSTGTTIDSVESLSTVATGSGEVNSGEALSTEAMAGRMRGVM